MRVAELMLPLVVVSCVIALTFGSELTRQPAGVIREGDTLVLTCTVEGKKFLDVVNIVKFITAENIRQVVAANTDVSEDYSGLGRYSVAFDGSVQTLTIDGIQPEDAGTYGCLLKTGSGMNQVGELDQVAKETIQIAVGPSSVVLSHGSSPDELESIPDGGDLQVTRGQPVTVTCQVTVEGSAVEPEVVITIDGHDKTSKFTRQPQVTDEQSHIGLYTRRRVETYTYTPNPDDIEITSNGKTLQCIATMPDMDPVSTAAVLRVKYAPSMECATHLNVAMGTPDVRLSCTGYMNPPPTAVEWAWEGGAIVYIDGGHNNATGGYRAGYEELGAEGYSFWLNIDEIDAQHYNMYTLVVDNGIGESETIIELLREGGEEEEEGDSSDDDGDDEPDEIVEPEENDIGNNPTQPVKPQKQHTDVEGGAPGLHTPSLLLAAASCIVLHLMLV